jgi:hypothetical protein
LNYLLAGECFTFCYYAIKRLLNKVVGMPEEKKKVENAAEKTGEAVKCLID